MLQDDFQSENPIQKDERMLDLEPVPLFSGRQHGRFVHWNTDSPFRRIEATTRETSSSSRNPRLRCNPAS